jgi:dihydroneopterin aldolase
MDSYSSTPVEEGSRSINHEQRSDSFMTERGVIRIKNAVFYAYHGVKQDEQNLGGKFELDVELVLDLAAATQTDSIKRTVDYESVYDYLQGVVTTKKYYLLEALANTIAIGLMREFPPIDEVTVRIRKPHPPVKGVVDHIEVEISKKR